MRHYYHNGELARIVNFTPDLNGKECIVVSRNEVDSEAYQIIYRGMMFTVHYTWIEPIQFKEDIAPSFDDELFEV